MSFQRKTVEPVRMTLQQFLDYDDGTDHRYELRGGILYPLYPEIRNGAIVGMNPPAPDHQDIARNILILWHTGTGRPAPCRTLPAAGIVIDAAKRDYYVPDVAFTCEIHGKKNLEAPTAVAEVLFPSTMLVDINEKLARYQQVPSVTEIWLVASRERWVAVYRRVDGMWTPPLPATGAGHVHSDLLGRLVELDEIYDRSNLATRRAWHGRLLKRRRVGWPISCRGWPPPHPQGRSGGMCPRRASGHLFVRLKQPMQLFVRVLDLAHASLEGR